MSFKVGDKVILGEWNPKEVPSRINFTSEMRQWVGRVATLTASAGSRGGEQYWQADVSPDYIWREANMIPADSAAMATALQEALAMSQDVKQMQEKLKEYGELFQRLQEAPAPFATVVSIRDNRVIIQAKGSLIEVAKPPVNVQPGQVVKIAPDTMQIVEPAKDYPALRAGEVTTVERVIGDLCEVDRNGSIRAVAYDNRKDVKPPEEGDRVVVDNSGSVIIANLGKLKTGLEFTASTGISWSDIGGLEEAKRQMREAIEGPKKNEKLYAKYKKKPIKGVLLSGPPGCGKTMLGKAAATAYAAVHGAMGAGAFFYMKGPEALNMYVGNTEAAIRQLFVRARDHKAKAGYPAILFIDEADAILARRGIGWEKGSPLSNTVVPMFLSEMDGLEESGALVLLATNRPDALDPAVVRDGRIDRRVRVPRPPKKAAIEIVHKLVNELPLAGSAKELAVGAVEALYSPELVLYRVERKLGDTTKFTLAHTVSGAMLAGLVDRATSFAMHRELESGKGSRSGVLEEDFGAAVLEAYTQAHDVSHDDELAEFVEGWEDDVHQVVKERVAA